MELERNLRPREIMKKNLTYHDIPDGIFYKWWTPKPVAEWDELDTSDVELIDYELDGCKMFDIKMSGFKFKDGTPLPPLSSLERDQWEEDIVGTFYSKIYELAYELIDWGNNGDFYE